MSGRAKRALAVAADMQREIRLWERSVGDSIRDTSDDAQPAQQPGALDQAIQIKIYDGLLQVSETLANSYAQVIRDLEDVERQSWAGTAHEIRQVIATMLSKLAPDHEVTSQSWYVQDPNVSGPTQKQRARYVLLERGAGSKEHEVAQLVGTLDGMIEDLVRAIYSRASDAAHRFKARDEVARILRYFEAFAQDLLGL